VSQYKGKSAGSLDGIAKDLNIVDDVEIRRLFWVLHIIVIVDEKIPKNILNPEFSNTGSAEKARTRREEVVQRGALQLVRIPGWRKYAGVQKSGGTFEGRQVPEGAVAPQWTDAAHGIFA
jgi:hypothetical protein